jgi:hypothetical protein
VKTLRLTRTASDWPTREAAKLKHARRGNSGRYPGIPATDLYIQKKFASVSDPSFAKAWHSIAPYGRGAMTEIQCQQRLRGGDRACPQDRDQGCMDQGVRIVMASRGSEMCDHTHQNRDTISASEAKKLLLD